VRHNSLLQRAGRLHSLQPLILLAIILVMILAQSVLVPGSLTLDKLLIISRRPDDRGG